MNKVFSRERQAVRRSIAQLAAPLALAEAVDFTVLLGIVAIMGEMGDNALYLRSLYQPVGFLLVALSVAFAVTNQVAAAISKGAGRPTEVMASALSLARIWFVSGVVIVVLLAVSAPALAAFLDVDVALRDDFASFLRWTAAAGLLVIGPALCASCLRGYGYAREATLVMICAAVAKIGCVAGIGLGAGVGIMSVPLAEVASGVTGLLIGLVMLRRKEIWNPAAVRSWRPEVYGGLWRIGAPVAASFLVIAAYNVGVLGVLGRFGPDAVSGFSVAAALQSLVLLPGTMIGTATAIVLNQQLGAAQRDRIQATLRGGLELSMACYVLIAVVMWLIAEPFARITTPTPSIAGETAAYLGVVALSFVVQGPVLAALTIMEHTGGGFLAIVLNAIYFGLVVAVGAIVAARVGSSSGFYDAVAACNLIGVSVPFFAVRHIRRLARAA